MPLVKPKDKEKRDDFLERCMGDETSVTDYPKRDQYLFAGWPTAQTVRRV